MGGFEDVTVGNEVGFVDASFAVGVWVGFEIGLAVGFGLEEFVLPIDTAKSITKRASFMNIFLILFWIHQ